jgi:hypothetical protein
MAEVSRGDQAVDSVAASKLLKKPKTFSMPGKSKAI